MKSIYNPLEVDDQGRTLGAPIKDWSFNYIKYDHKVGEIWQYDDATAEALLLTYPFLQDLSPSDALKKKEELENKKAFSCKYCPFSTNAEIALKGHMRTHKDLIIKEQTIDPNIIPRAEGSQSNPFKITDNMQKPKSSIVDETTGPEFYGEGFQEKKGI